MITPVLRSLTPAEIDILIDWAASEGWNPGLHDAELFRIADPDGFIGAFVDGEMVSGISAVAYGNDYGFIGLYIAREDMRGRGYGRAAWNAGVARLDGSTIGLDGVPEQQENYRSKGFAKVYGNIRYSGRFHGSSDVGGGVFPVTSVLHDSIIEFDRAFFPAPRAGFLQMWLGLSHCAYVCSEGDQVTGYGVARECRDGYKIGPLFARNPNVANALLSALARDCDGDISIDVPDHQTAFITVLEAGGLRAGFETARMYRGAAPSITLDGVFAVTTLELG